MLRQITATLVLILALTLLAASCFAFIEDARTPARARDFADSIHLNEGGASVYKAEQQARRSTAGVEGIFGTVLLLVAVVLIDAEPSRDRTEWPSEADWTYRSAQRRQSPQGTQHPRETPYLPGTGALPTPLQTRAGAVRPGEVAFRSNIAFRSDKLALDSRDASLVAMESRRRPRTARRG